MASDLLSFFLLVAINVITATKTAKVSAITTEDETIKTENKATMPIATDFK